MQNQLYAILHAFAKNRYKRARVRDVSGKMHEKLVTSVTFRHSFATNFSQYTLVYLYNSDLYKA